MESSAARSLALHAVRCFRRQWNPVLNSGLLLDQQRFGALAGCAPGVEAGVVDSTPRGFLTTTTSELTDDEVFSRDRVTSHLDSLIAPIRNAEVGHASGGWNRLHMMNSFSPSETRPRCLEFDGLLLNSAQREQIEHLAFLERRTSDRVISRFVPDVPGSGREIRSLATAVMDSSVEACSNICSEQAVKPRNEVSRLASLLGCGEANLWLSLDNIPFECSSVKRKRKKKMNKHKQRKLRRRDRHRNT